MKKFLIVCLSVVMLLSTTLLCGFNAPLVQVESLNYSTPVVGETVENLYFNSFTNTDEEMHTYFKNFALENGVFVQAGDYSLYEVRDLLVFDNYNLTLTYTVQNGVDAVFFTNQTIFFALMSGTYVSIKPLYIPINSTLVSISPLFDDIKSFFSTTMFTTPLSFVTGTSLPNIPISESSPVTIDGIFINFLMSNNAVIRLVNENLIPGNSYSIGYGTFSMQGITYYARFILLYYDDLRIQLMANFGTPTAGEFALDLFYYDPDDSVNYPGWNYVNINTYLSVLGNPFSSFFTNTTSFYNVTEGDEIANDLLSSLFSSSPFLFEKPEMKLPGDIVDIFATIFTDYIPLLASGIVSMFTALFWTGEQLTVFGYAMLTIIGVCFVYSIFRTVYRIFKNRPKKRL